MMILDGVSFNVASHDSIDGEARHCFDAELLCDVLAMGDYCSETNIEFVGYLFIDKATSYEAQYLYLTHGQVILEGHLVTVGRMNMRMAFVMPVLMQQQDGLNQVLLILIDVKG